MASPKLFLHDFPKNTDRFPPWSLLPLESEEDGDSPSSSSWPGGAGATTHFLVAQISENMTITKPTLILHDRDGHSFALTFDDDKFSLQGWRKGHSVVVPGARRTPSREEGKKGFVKVPPGPGGCDEARCVPVGLEKAVLLAVREVGGGEEGGSSSAGTDLAQLCTWCKGDGSGQEMKKCTGCGWVKYCSKQCQVKDWGQDHKGECKGYKALRELQEKYP